MRRQKGGKDPSFAFRKQKKEAAKHQKVVERLRAQSAQETAQSTKVKLRPAEDILRRLQWDPVFADVRAHIRVGYIDRLVEGGVMRASLQEFEEEGVPLHRIRYFSLGRVPVWNRKRRVDRLFRAPGAAALLAEFEQSGGDLEEEKNEEHEESVKDPWAGLDGDELAPDKADISAVKEEDGEASLEKMNEDGEVKTAGVEEKRKRPGGHVRPTHFLSFPLHMTSLATPLSQLQDALQANEPLLGSARILPSRFHVSLLMLHLPTPAHVARCKAVLLALRKRLHFLILEEKEKRELIVRGVDAFGSRVLFTKIAGGNCLLERAAAVLKEEMEKEGLVCPDDRELSPHITLFKTSLPRFRKSVKKKARAQVIPRALASADRSTVVGSVEWHALDLCAMGGTLERDNPERIVQLLGDEGVESEEKAAPLPTPPVSPREVCHNVSRAIVRGIFNSLRRAFLNPDHAHVASEEGWVTVTDLIQVWALRKQSATEEDVVAVAKSGATEKGWALELNEGQPPSVRVQKRKKRKRSRAASVEDATEKRTALHVHEAQAEEEMKVKGEEHAKEEEKEKKKEDSFYTTLLRVVLKTAE